MKNSIEKNKLYKFLIIFLSIILIIVIFSQKNIQIKFLSLFNGDNISNINIKKGKTINLESVKNAVPYNDSVIVYSGNKLSGYDYDGKNIWEKDLVLNNYDLYFGEMNIYIYEKSSGYIQFINSKGDIFKEINLGEEIIGLKEDNRKILVHTKNEGTEKINILDEKGDTVEVNNLEIKNILTYTSARDYNSYGISILNPETPLDSRFIAFKYGELILYRKEFKDEMVLYSEFIDSHRVVIMTDKNIYLLNDFEGNTLWKKNYELIKDINIINGKINILYGNKLEILSASGNIDSKYSFIEDYTKITPLDDFVIAYGKNNIIAIKDGVELFSEEVKSELIKIESGKNNFIVIYKDKVDIYNIVK